MSFKLNLGLNDCSNQEYHSDSEYLSSSDYKLLLKDPGEFYEKKYGPKQVQEEKSNLLNGSFVHSSILEPHLTKSEFAIYPGLVKRGAAYEQFKLQHPNKSILNAGQAEACRRMILGYNRLPEAVELIKGGFSEHTLCQIFDDIATKVRADYINVDKGYIVDIKTSYKDSGLENFRDTIEEWSYDLSAALYTAMYEQFYQKSFTFYWLVLSSKDFEAHLYRMGSKTRYKGMAQVRKAASIFKQCKESGLWTSEEKDAIVKKDSVYEILEV